MNGQVALPLLARSIWSRLRAGPALIGSDFDRFGRLLGLKLCFRGRRDLGFRLLVNPVSIVRYFEFPFVDDRINAAERPLRILDISSPFLLPLKLAQENQRVEITMINPDEADIEHTRQVLRLAFPHLQDRLSLECVDATALPFPDDHFDAVTCVSVIEHVPNSGDSQIMKEIRRVLRRGGQALLTFPCKRIGEEEWRESDEYGLQSRSDSKDGLYFFQRFYDRKTVEERLSKSFRAEPEQHVVFGEKVAGLFADYERRWMRRKLAETCRDSLHIAEGYCMFPSIDDLPGLGVSGCQWIKK